jgi:dihydrofolate synthase / folylpolyglutamate synthase
VAPRTLAEWLALHESVHPKTIDLGLARVRAVAERLGVATLACPVITVAGTNGKGSTVAHLEALFMARGARTGLFTSPHFVHYNERIRIAGREVEDAPLLAAFERIEAARADLTLTFFEYNTLAALLAFQAAAVDIALLEVGLGGRLDATNLVDADVAVLASVGFDHRDWLGDTLEQIGAEKAGIFRAQRPAVLGTADMPASVTATAAALGTHLVVAERDFDWQVEEGGWDYSGLALRLQRLPPSALKGAIQYRNAATAFAAAEALEGDRSARAAVRGLVRRLAPLDERSAATALRSVRLAGRFQVVPGAVEWILDIAHNPPAASVLAAELRARPLPRDGGRTLAVIGVLTDKDAAGIAAALTPLIDEWFVCALPGPRGSGADSTLERLQLPPGRALHLAGSIVAGCELARAAAAPGDRIVVCGSVHSVGPALEWLRIY